MREQVVNIEDANLNFRLIAGETIHTENSYKFTDRGAWNPFSEMSVLRSEGHGKTVAVGTPSRLLACRSHRGSGNHRRKRVLDRRYL